MITIPSAWTQRAGVLLLRWAVAGLLLLHGIAKLQRGLGGVESLLSSKGLPAWFAFGVLIGEVVAPLLVMAGVLVRPAALVMALNMAVAVALAHPAQVFELGRTGGYALELQALFFFGALAIALLGSGRAKT